MTDQTANLPVWQDGDPLMEAIAATVYAHCEVQHGSGIVIDDPRNIAAAAVAAVRAAARQAAGQPAAECACGHAAHAPGDECEDSVQHGPKRWHRCLCLNRAGANMACPPDMDCQGGTLGYSDIWHKQRGYTPLVFVQSDPTTADDLIPPAVGLAAPTNHNTETEARARLAALIGYESDEYDAEFEQHLAAYRAAILNSAADDLFALDPAEAALAGQHAWVDAANLLRRLAAGAES